MAYRRIYTPAPVDLHHPLNTKRVMWLLGIPGLTGSQTWYDLVGKNNGTVNSGVTWNNDSLLFPGVDTDNVSVPYTISLDAIGVSYTIAVTCTPDSIATNDGIYDKTIGGATNQQYQIYKEGSTWKYREGSTGIVTATATAGVTVRLTATFLYVDASTCTSSLYVNAVSQGTLPFFGAANSGSGVTLIGQLGSGVFPLTGTIKDVSFWNGRCLTDAEVGYDYYASRMDYQIPDSPLNLLSTKAFSGTSPPPPPSGGGSIFRSGIFGGAL